MIEGDRETSGELSSFLHLTGWRPLLLALVAGLAGAIGLFMALRAPAEFQARYTLNAQRIADDDFTPQQLDIFVEEIAQTGKFPQVERVVRSRTGLVIEDDYQITVGQSGSTLSNVDINVVANQAEDAQNVAIETGIEAMTVTLNKVLAGHEASAGQVEDSIAESEAVIRDLTEQAGGINPSTAYDLAVQAVITRREIIRNPLTETIRNADGTTTVNVLPEPEPPLPELEAEANRLEPLDRAYRNEIAGLDALNLRLATQRDNIRDARAAIGLVDSERDTPIIISEVVTEETSRIAGLLTGLLMFAVPAALLMILLFVLFDMLRKKPEQMRRADDFDPAGVLEAQGHRALPEGSVTPLIVVDEDQQHELLDNDILQDEEEMIVSVEEDDDEDDDDDEPKSKKRSKDGRWGRDASSKAG